MALVSSNTREGRPWVSSGSLGFSERSGETDRGGVAECLTGLLHGKRRTAADTRIRMLPREM